MKDWMISIIFYMLFCSLIHNIAPNKNYRKYISYVMGIIMLIVLMNPIIKIMKWENKDSISYYVDSLEMYLDNAKDESGSFYDYYDMSMEQALITFLSEKGIIAESVELIKDEEGNILKTTVYLQEDEKIQTATDAELDVKRLISQFYKLKLDSIYVIR